MDRTRGIFFGLIVLAAIGIGTGAYVRNSSQNTATAVNTPQPVANAPATAVSKPAATVEAPKVADAQPTAAATQAPAADPAQADVPASGKFAPIFAKNTVADLPKFVCGAYSVGSYHTLLQIQQSGLDHKYDFNLGIVPFYLSEDYTNSEADRAKMLQEGKLDCLLTTLDAVAGLDHGLITGIVDESAGADQIWARNLTSINDLKGKRVTYEAGGPSEYFAFYILSKVGITRNDVTLLPQPTINDAVKAFNDEQADVVIGWDPVIYDAEKSGGKLLISTREFRPIMDVIVTNREIAAKRGKVVERFHEAWFEALMAQSKDFDAAAKQVAAWGNNAWSGVTVESASDDWASQLGGFAQANMRHNKVLLSDTKLLIDRLTEAGDLLKANGVTLPARPVSEMLDPQFALRAFEEFEAQNVSLDIKLVNNTFAYGQPANAAPAVASSGDASVPTSSSDALLTEVATLPCNRFEFIPNTTKLMPESQKLLEDCALKTMRESAGVFMRVKASSAWPGPKGSYTQQQVEDVAKARANAIADWLASQGISRDRFVIEWVLPPEERRETNDLALQSKDRFVELALLISGL
jgi:ABC-type nitrate/sulfonate/bicarbonate transport system substrate-binding protein